MLQLGKEQTLNLCRKLMKISNYAWALSLSAILLSSCASSRKPISFAPKNSFLPAELAEAVAEEDSPAKEEVTAKQSLLVNAAPVDLGRQDVRQNQVDMLIHESQMRFESGRRFHQLGQFSRARAEFDAALDQLTSSKPENNYDRARIERQREQMIERVFRFDLEAQDRTADSEDAALQAPRFEKAPLEEVLKSTFPVDPKLKLQIKEELAMTRSELPLELADPVVQFIQYFSRTEEGRRKMLFGLKRQGRYRAMISKELQEAGLPAELIYLAQAESAFQPRVKSWASAVGMWQFMRATGNEYGLKQTSYVDDRMDPEKATKAALHHLKDLYKRTGDWYLAIAAYNCGIGCVENAVARTGHADFWELRARRAVPLETTNYVPIIVAFAIMMKNPEKYGFTGVVEDNPLRYESVTVDANTHLGLITGITDGTSADLEELNPSLISSLIPSGHQLRVPVGTAEKLESLKQIPVEKRSSMKIHKAVEGETVASIASRYGVNADSVMPLGVGADEIGPGVMVAVPLPPPPAVYRYVWTKKRGKRVMVAVRIPTGRAATGRAVASSARLSGKSAVARGNFRARGTTRTAMAPTQVRTAKALKTAKAVRPVKGVFKTRKQQVRVAPKGVRVAAR
jgi:membrane-bound lytic murein transglycosylase D